MYIQRLLDKPVKDANTENFYLRKEVNRHLTAEQQYERDNVHTLDRLPIFKEKDDE